MKDYELEVLDRYGLSVKSTRKMRGAFFCDTDEGAALLKETYVSDGRALFLCNLLQTLTEKGYRNVDLIIPNKDGELKSGRFDGSFYILKRWFSGRECDAKREGDLLLAAENLAFLHKILRQCDARKMSADGACLVKGRALREEFARRSREMKKVREFIRKKVSKGPFEYLYLDSYEKMSKLSQRVQTREINSSCDKLYEESIGQKTLIHGNYNYHNVLITPQGAATTNFERCRIDVQAADFAYFLRKAMEKHGWDKRLGRALIYSYQKISILSREEKEYIAVGLSYPEKFWKAADGYYRSNKALIPEKSVEKLRIAVAQTKERLDFLENVFTLNL